MRRLLSVLIAAFLLGFCGPMARAHPMPYSVLLLDIKHNGIAAELQWPLKELQLIYPDGRIDADLATLLARKEQWLDDYLLQHMWLEDDRGGKWTITITSLVLKEDEQNLSGRYHELVFRLLLQPPPGASTRHFTLHYDAIMHMVVTHKLFIRIRSDRDGGLAAKDSAAAELGVIGVNMADGTVTPVVVDLDEGSRWKGFVAMVHLGIGHIAEGTDHLLFLLVLMLAAPFTAENGRWRTPRGTRRTLLQLLKVVTAFTIGHSISLVVGALGWVTLPQQPVEVAIAITILLTAVHSLRPILPGKEALIAVGFGVIHGSAFATAISGLDLDSGRMALSILGFNIGIELMQVFVMICVVPWLILLSRNKGGHRVRIGGAVFAIIASVAWGLERITGQPNPITPCVERIAQNGPWVLLALALAAIACSVEWPGRARPKT